MNNSPPTNKKTKKQTPLVKLIRASLHLCLSSGAAAAIGLCSSQAWAQAIPGRFIVIYKTPEAATKGKVQTAAVLESARQAIASSATKMRASLSGRGKLRYSLEKNGLQGYVADLQKAEVDALRADLNVAIVEQDSKVRIAATQLNPASWGLDRIDQRTLPLSSGYSYNYTGSGVRSYVLDTGILASHTEFTGRVLAGKDFINDGQGTNDCHGHGTHVAGTIGGTQYGVAKGTSIIPVRVLSCSGYGDVSGLVAALDWVVGQNAKPAVVNMSIGGPASDALDTAVANAVSNGYTVVVSAGNSSSDACTQSPARATTAITVAATDSTDARSSFSNIGSCVDVFAPGANILSAYHTSPTSTITMSGTSMASPHVAGIAALALQSKPAATPSEVTALIKAQATTGVVSNLGLDSPNLMVYSQIAFPAVNVQVSLAKTKLNPGESTQVMFNFNVPVKGFDESDVGAAGKISGLTSTDGGKTWTMTYTTPANAALGSEVSVSVKAGSYTDLVGNLGTFGQSIAQIVDTIVPTLNLTLAKTILAPGETVNATFAFSETVTGFTVSDIGAPGKIGALVSKGDGKTWTIPYTVPTNAALGSEVSVSVKDGSYTDLSSNLGKFAQAIAKIGNDGTAPTVVVSLPKTTLAAGETSVVTFTFSKAVKGFDMTDVAAPGKISGLASSDGGKTWTLSYTTPATAVSGSEISVSVKDGSYTDLSGNLGKFAQVIAKIK